LCAYFRNILHILKQDLVRKELFQMRIRAMLLCVPLLLFLLGCTPEKGDYFAPFRGEFTAELSGEWAGAPLEAHLAAAAPDENGARVMTLTFYVPQGLCGTVLRRDPSGTLALSAGELSLPLDATAAAGYAALLELFPTCGEIRTVTRENGNTRLTGEGFSLLFAPDGTPLAAENAAARVQVTAWGTR
jgi:hypothetical protein